MVNSQIVSEVVNSLKLDILKDAIPNPVPVVEVGMKLVKNGFSKSVACINNQGVAIYTTPSNQDFYLTGASLSFIKDVTSTSTASTINYIRDANTETILNIPSISLTVQSETLSIELKNPIKIDRGTALNVTNSTSIANIRTIGTIYGFLDEIS